MRAGSGPARGNTSHVAHRLGRPSAVAVMFSSWFHFCTYLNLPGPGGSDSSREGPDVKVGGAERGELDLKSQLQRIHSG